MADANLRIQRIDELHVQARKIEIEIREEKTQLLDDIKKGATTGDRIKDFVILICGLGYNNEEFEAMCYTTYRDLDNQVSQHDGELVLTIMKDERIKCCTGFDPEPRDEDYVLETNLYLGIINSRALVLNLSECTWCFPTVNYVSCLDVGCHQKIELVDGNLSIFGGYCSLPHLLNKPLKHKNPRVWCQKTPNIMLEVIIGDSEVKKLMQERHYVPINDALKLLNKTL